MIIAVGAFITFTYSMASLTGAPLMMDLWLVGSAPLLLLAIFNK